MAPQPSLKLHELPNEILLQILSYLRPSHISLLQLVCRALRSICLDDKFWKLRCFDESKFLESILRSRRLAGSATGESSDNPTPNLAVARLTKPVSTIPDADTKHDDTKDEWLIEQQRRRDVENWDPTFPGETVGWYDEYIHRQGPIVVNWFQQPRIQDDGCEDTVDVRGMALYTPDGGNSEYSAGALLAVSPLDDGSVCLWDVNGFHRRKGAIVARSKPGILFIDGPDTDVTQRSKRIDTGVTECISVDNQGHRAFIAVQSHLLEIDLRRLEMVNCQSFEWSITTLSTAHAGLPLTVGTALGIHLHDYRVRGQRRREVVERVDSPPRVGARNFYEEQLRQLFDDDPLPPYASLSQPTPLSILHLPRAGSPDLLTDDIYVAGRFTSVLHYDRRKFPSIVNSIFSGASLSSLACLPYPFSTVDCELRRRGELSSEQLQKSKTLEGGRTLIACGEYNTKGSLELYGLLPSAGGSTGLTQNSTMKNRQTSAQSKILSVANHGTRLVCSDSSGHIKWFERDGFTEVRHHKIGHSEVPFSPSIFAGMPGSDDLARKILVTESGWAKDKINANDILFWTGEKLGMLGFSAQPGFAASDFEAQRSRTPQEELEEAEERRYVKGMRRALETQADEVRFVRDLGLGMGTGTGTGTGHW